VNINPEMRVKVVQGPARPELVEQGWRVFLVKVRNESGTTAKLEADSPNAKRLHGSPEDEVANRWLEREMYDKQPLRETLSGLALEYRILSLYSRDAGKREAKVSFNVGQGTQDLGFRNEADVMFHCVPAQRIVFHVRDEHNQPTTASFVIRDAGAGLSLASQTARAGFRLSAQVYRADGETVRLPEGTYTVECSRGPESIPRKQTILVTPLLEVASFQVERWIDPSKFGWWSGDHHIHAAGCAITSSHGRSARAGHVPPLRGRGLESRGQSHVGSVLRLSKAVFLRHRR